MRTLLRIFVEEPTEEETPRQVGGHSKRGFTRQVMPLREALINRTTHKHSVMHRTTEQKIKKKKKNVHHQFGWDICVAGGCH